VRRKAQTAVAPQRPLYERLLQIAEQTWQQARTVRQARERVGDQQEPSRSHASTPPAGRAQAAPARGAPNRLQAALDRFLPLVAQVAQVALVAPVIQQARTRVLEAQQVPAQAKLVSRFAPHTRVLRRHKTGTPVEFGRHVGLDEVDGGSVTRYRRLGPGAVERHEWAPAVAQHRTVCGRPPHLVTAERGFHVVGQAVPLQAGGVRHVVVPTSGRATTQPRAQEHQRAGKRRYRWRAGSEGRIHSLRRD
jgi:transposase, IS5 family